VSAPESIEARREREALLRHQREADLREAMSTPGGRRYLWRVWFDVCGVMGDPGVYTVVDSERITERNLGRAAVGRELILDAQRIAPELYEQMVVEQMRNRRIEQTAPVAAAVPAPSEPSTH